MGIFKKKTVGGTAEYTEERSAEAHKIKNEIQQVLSQSSLEMRKRRAKINKEFDKLELSFLDASRAIAIASGGRKRGLKL